MQQGEPLAPALFGIAIHDCIEEATRVVKEEFGDESLQIHVCYLDDGVAAGEARAVAR